LIGFQTVIKELLLDAKIRVVWKSLLLKIKRIREIFKELFFCSNCSKLGIIQDLFKIIKKRMRLKKDIILNG